MLAFDRRANEQCERIGQPLHSLLLPFWFKRKSHFRLFPITVFIANPINFTSTHYLALTYLYGCQEDFNLTVLFPDLHPSLRCRARSFIQSPRFILLQRRSRFRRDNSSKQPRVARPHLDWRRTLMGAR